MDAGSAPRSLCSPTAAGIVHVLECLLCRQSPHDCHKGGPPGNAREAVFRAYERHQVSVDPGCRDGLGLPGLQFHGVARVDQVSWVDEGR